MKRYILCLLALLTALLLTACGCDHEWEDATCRDPRTCALCGETEGEKLDHEWEDATCTAPRTCSLCGKEQGEALGHQLSDATRLERPKCGVCGVEEGLSLTEQVLEKFPATESRHDGSRFLMTPEEFMLLYLEQLDGLELDYEIQRREDLETEGAYVLDFLCGGTAAFQISMNVDPDTGLLHIVTAGMSMDLSTSDLDGINTYMEAVNAAFDAADPLMDDAKWEQFLSGGEMSYMAGGLMLRNSFDGVGYLCAMSTSSYYLMITPDMSLGIFQ